jgi:hypothetical protein
MPTANLYINQIDVDNEFYVWGSGQDIRRFNGMSWEYYGYQNSAVPQPNGSPYYLDTRCLSIDNEETLWCGVAQGVESGYNQVAVFNIDTNDPEIGNSWKFSDLGTFGVQQEISLIYACPFGDDVLAFCSPLNGTGLTAAASTYSRIQGSTGGRLFYYLKEIDRWYEEVEGYVWPHIYDIKTKGVDGKSYLYYIGTKEGLYVFPQGSLSTISLNDGTKIIKQATVYNTKTSGIISDTVYSLDFDEEGNLWIGTDIGLSYFNGVSFWNYGTTGPVTLVKARKNGHVFYAKGDGELSQGTGIWHFNGNTHTQYNSSNSSLSSDNVLGIELVGDNIGQNSFDVRAGSLWVLGYNTLASFEYDVPHVYASSKYSGATGWNFVYYSPTGGTSPSPIPKVNKYTWTYPEWRVYQNDELEYKHPGLDPRNLFLTTKLSDIADGRAGGQAYWNNYPIPTYDQDLLTNKIQSPKWITQLNPNIGNDYEFKITSSATLTINGSNRLYIGGKIAQNKSINFGSYNDGTPLTITGTNGFNINSTDTGFSYTGFVVSYDDCGCVKSSIVFNGVSTEVTSMKPSPDGNSIVVSGTYNLLIENGPYVYSGLASAVTGYSNGPSGAPLGITNSGLTGATSGAYPWIYSATGATGSKYTNGAVSSLTYRYSPGNSATSGNCDFLIPTGATAGSFGSVSKILLNDLQYSTLTSAYLYLDNLPFRYAMTIGTAVSPSLYGYYSILSGYKETVAGRTRFVFSVSFQSGSGSTSIPTTSDLVFNVYTSSNKTFPLIPSLSSLLSNTVLSSKQAPGVFVAEVEKDLGEITSFTGITGGYDESIRKSYRVINFRSFPSTSIWNGTYDSSTVTSDVTDYTVNVLIPHYNKLSTLKNLWLRNNDSYKSPEYLTDLTDLTFDWRFLSCLSLNRDDFSIRSGINSASNQDLFYNDHTLSISSLNTGSSLITGYLPYTIPYVPPAFNFGGADLVSSSGYGSQPYYILVSSEGFGVTGGFIENGLTAGATAEIYSTKTGTSYYITTAFGPTASYFGTNVNSWSVGTGGNPIKRAITAQITEQASVRRIFSFDLGESYNGAPFLKDARILSNGQYFMSYSNFNSTKTKYVTNIVKTDTKGNLLDSNNFGTRSIDLIFSTSKSSDIYMTSSSYGTTGAGTGFISPSYPAYFTLKSEQYKPELGINLGNIISRSGSGAWTWCDVHSSNNHLEIPLMSTVVFNNYSADIYGKKNNVWILSDSLTGEEILNVKSTPYFIYTFTKSGYYQIYNQVEDSFGNVYEASLPGFIQVIDHKNKRPDDNNPNFVDSTDYGYPEPSFVSRDYDVRKLEDDLMVQEKEILENNRIQFGVEVVIPDNPDATFDSEPA